MAAYTASTSGNWNSSSTWGGAGIPVSGDTGTINTGVTVTIPDGYDAVIGATGQATGYTALTLNSTTAKLVIGGGASGSLTLQGDIAISATTSAPSVTMAAGSRLTFKPSNAQRIKVDFLGNNASNYMTVNGSSGARCTINTDSTALSGGGLKGWFRYAGGVARQIITMTYCDCTDLDDGSTNGFAQSAATTAGQHLTWTNNTFTRCGKVYLNANGNNTGNINFTNNTFTSSTGTSGNCFDIRFNNALTSGQRNITGNDFDLIATHSNAVGCTIEYNTYRSAPVYTDATTSQWASNRYNLHTWTATGSTGVRSTGDLTNNYFAVGGTTNPHIVLTPSTLAYGPTIDGNVFEAVNTSQDGAGDCVIVGSGASAGLTVTITRNLVLPTEGVNKQAGTMLTGNASSNAPTIVLEHNTCYAGSQAAFAYSETVNLAAGKISSLKANLVWQSSAAGTGSYIAIDSSHAASGGTQDVVSPTNADYNGSYNIHREDPSTYSGNTYTHAGNGYQGNFSATPGANDPADTNPNFVDSTRNIGWWAVSVGQAVSGDSYATKVAAAISYIVGDPTNRIPALLTYVKSGFRPQSSTFHTSYPGDPSTTDADGNSWSGSPSIGAMAYYSAGPTDPVFPNMSMACTMP